jgi:uncharacterized MAPEG superfamily protein
VKTKKINQRKSKVNCGATMFSRKFILCTIVFVYLTLLGTCDARSRRSPKKKVAATPAPDLTPDQLEKQRQEQLFQETRETNTPNFVRLVLMRLIYGIASTMGVEERISGLFNGAFVPPNADNDYFDFFGGGGGSDDDDYGDLGLDF